MKQLASVLFAMIAVAIPGIDQFQDMSPDLRTGIHLALEIVQAGLLAYLAPTLVQAVRGWASKS